MVIKVVFGQVIRTISFHYGRTMKGTKHRRLNKRMLPDRELSSIRFVNVASANVIRFQSNFVHRIKQVYGTKVDNFLMIYIYDFIKYGSDFTSRPLSGTGYFHIITTAL